MKNCWLTLRSDVFLWLTQDECLIYNSNNHKKLSFTVNDEIRKICQQLLIPINLYTVEISEISLEEKSVRQWIDCIIDNDAGYLKPCSNTIKPISLKPILKIQDSINYYTKKYNEELAGEIIHNLYELTFYINGSEYGNNSWYKQTVFPLKSCQPLDIQKLFGFIQNAKSNFLSNINLSGNIFLYPDYVSLVEEICNSKIRFTINITIQDFEDNIQRIKEIQWTDNTQFNILIDSQSDFTLISLDGLCINMSVTVLVFTEENYKSIIDKLDTLPVYRDAQITPIYNGENFDFFHSNVFISKSEINEIALSKREVFMRQAINIYDFGKLTVLSDEQVFANVNMNPLGSINNSMVSLIYKEFTKGQSWLRIRDQKPCADCIYQWLCPSPSNYEIAIGKPNLCHIIE
ncbi:MAG: TIGR04150 pseudo-rSAM protein [Bacteroidales bacterium]|jgi:pseudo-rSAM protein|nr:TIGR04150 pseudo-rSAM protein [Bacteroidales bacterium]